MEERFPGKEPPVAPLCDDQLPIFSTIGRGIKGDSFEIVISDPDSDSETYLEGRSFDEATQSYTTEWKSDNINGGQLLSSITFHPYQSLPTFTMNFKYLRPGRTEWSLSTPAIPYYVDVDGQNNGTGVAAVYVRNVTGGTDDWQDATRYPSGTTGQDWNAPAVGQPWTVNLTYGLDGDIACATIEDLGTVIGVSADDVKKLFLGHEWSIGGNSIKAYIDKKIDEAIAHLHADLGFGQEAGHGSTGSFGGHDTLKAYIDSKITNA